jgi:hypothetical protein
MCARFMSSTVRSAAIAANEGSGLGKESAWLNTQMWGRPHLDDPPNDRSSFRFLRGKGVE